MEGRMGERVGERVGERMGERMRPQVGGDKMCTVAT